jgi:hypothetical protein
MVDVFLDREVRLILLARERHDRVLTAFTDRARTLTAEPCADGIGNVARRPVLLDVDI